MRDEGGAVSVCVGGKDNERITEKAVSVCVSAGDFHVFGIPEVRK